MPRSFRAPRRRLAPPAALFAVGGAAALALSVTPAAATAAAATAATQATSLSADANQKVIVLLKDQPAVTGSASARSVQRMNAIHTSQAPFLSELAKVHATGVKTYSLVNGFAATVSTAEENYLKATPGVAEVIPDSTIYGPSTTANQGAKSTGQAASSSTACTPDSSGSMLEPEALSLTHSTNAQALGFTGAGVKVAFMADGVDTSNWNFLDKNGDSIFTSYVDFTGDGATAPTSGGEAFIDANAIAGQGLKTVSTAGFSSGATSCTIRIEGVAPGVSLVGLKVFGQTDTTTTSAFLQAIQWAWLNGVSVLNQSFGSNPYPDVSSLDIISKFDQQAVKAGVTITVSSGDAGPFDTIGSPSSDSSVISVGATTDLRFYQLANYGGASLSNGTWISDNISQLSSGGYTESGRTINLVAPGDMSFASCTPDTTTYADCTNFLGQASDIELSGGTSQASPIVAGAAALVIQAYRSAHNGASPSPALIKQILTSTADDLGAPATEQGAGLLDTDKAVEEALTINEGTTPTGDTLTTSTNQLNYTGATGSKATWPVTVTNTGTTAQTVNASTRTFGASATVKTATVTLSNSDKHFVNYAGYTTDYAPVTFTVPSGAKRLLTEIAYPDRTTVANPIVRITLVSPSGQLAGYSLPQGIGNHGTVSVLNPAAGTWTAYVWVDEFTSNTTTAAVPFRASVAGYAAFGSVTPPTFTLAPGASRKITVTGTVPSGAGDASGSVVLNAGYGATTIPVTLRGLVNTAKGGAFSGTETGGNGREGLYEQAAYYQFSVPSGKHSVAVNLKLANDPANEVDGYLIAPDGQTVGYGSNYYITGETSSGFTTKSGTGLSLYTLNPAAGTWTLVLDFPGVVVGNELDDSYSGHVTFSDISASAKGLPNSVKTKLTAGKTHNATVTIKNTGVAAETIYPDARLTSTATYNLGSYSDQALPLTGGSYPTWLVPSETSAVTVVAKATVPVMFDYGNVAGDPDLVSSTGTSATGSFAASPVTAGVWYAAPSELQKNGYTTGTLKSLTMSATARKFDSTILSTSTGDFWESLVTGSVGWAPLVLQPGKSVTLKLTIKPSGKKGSVVRGTLFVDTATDGYLNLSGSEVAAIGYTYTIG